MGRAVPSCSISPTSTASKNSIRKIRRSARWSHSAMFYLIGTLYPLVGGARHLPRNSASRNIRAKVGTSDASEAKKEEARKAAADAIAEPLDVFRAFYIGDQAFIGGASPSIADIRLAATLEFLKAIDYKLPRWAEDYLAAIEKALGQAYSEPAADVRGYIDYVKSQRK